MNKKHIKDFFIIYMVLILFGAIFPTNIFGTFNEEIIDQQQPEIDGCWACSDGKCMMAQSFRPNLSMLTKIELVLERWGNPNGKISISLCDSIKPINVIIEKLISSSEIEEGHKCETWVEIDLIDMQFERNQTYYILYNPKDATNWDYYNTISIGAGEYDQYKRGESWWYHPSAGWYTDDKLDLSFKLYGENTPPEIPEIITGPDEGTAGGYCEFIVKAFDPDFHDLSYGWDWDGDDIVDEWTDFYDSGKNVTTYYSWLNPGVYKLKVKVKDVYNASSEYSESFTIEISGMNDPPDKPTIEGTDSGIPFTNYTFTFKAIDPENANIFYYIEWGDGSNTDWFGPFISGQEINFTHNWSERGQYTIKSKVKDLHGAESEWATLEVTMPKNKIINTPFLNFLENYPNMFPILRYILGL